MANHNSNGWQPPPPPHAGSTGWIAAVSRNGHRALRIFVRTGTWGAGICLIVGLTVLIVTAIGARHSKGPPSPDHHIASRPGQEIIQGGPDGERGPGPTTLPMKQPPTGWHHIDHPAAAPSAQPSGHATPPLAAFSGVGSLTTMVFTVTTQRSWQLQWSYACPSEQRGGSFSFRVVTANKRGNWLGPGKVPSGSTGNGVSVQEPGSPQHYLIVKSACAWAVQVTTGDG